MSWRVARSLDTLLAEINAAAPNRDKAADGSIGDTAHSSRASDHNPNPAGVVRARDFTHDPGTFDAHALAERVRLLGIKGHPALGPGAYVISNGRIASATYGWAWRGYSGSNPHAHHAHVSVATAAAGYDSTRPWGVMGEPDDMFSDDDSKRLARIEQMLTDQRKKDGERMTRLIKMIDKVRNQASDDATKRDLDKVADEIKRELA